MSSIPSPSFDPGPPTERIRPKSDDPGISTERVRSESEIPTQKNPERQKSVDTMTVKERPDWVDSVVSQTPERVQVFLNEDRDRRSAEMQKWKEDLDLQEDPFDQEAEERIRTLAQESGSLISDIYSQRSISSAETLVFKPEPESEAESAPTDFAAPGRYDDFRLPPTPKPPQFSEEEQKFSDT